MKAATPNAEAGRHRAPVSRLPLKVTVVSLACNYVYCEYHNSLVTLSRVYSDFGCISIIEQPPEGMDLPRRYTFMVGY
ncbi:hypothetical protein IFM89_005739 [Coptis chinensis]|uniref:Uncharacterized protein n=1 Tax=Coptis chinensis TaxID=261450 RepID=A0A835IJU6_9MAGN|nr:hypothetical protein IFM89_005739 [Coptis chinensis]